MCLLVVFKYYNVGPTKSPVHCNTDSVLYQLAQLTVSICMNISLQKKEAERPKVEVVQEEEEEIVHEDNEWGEHANYPS